MTVGSASLGRGFTRLWAGNAAGNLSDGIVFVAIPLMAAALTQDPVVIAGLAVAHSAVRLLVVVPVGVLVDRLDRRTILSAVTFLRALLLIGLALLFSSGHGSLAALYAVFIGLGIVETAADNAALSLLPSIVPHDNLDRANGRVSAAQLIADEFAGPPLGGVLFALAAALPVAVAGGLHLAAGAFFLALPRGTREPRDAGVDAANQSGGAEPGAPVEPRPSILRDAAAGASWLRQHRVLGGIAVIGGIASVGYMMPFAVLVLYAGDRLGLDAAGYGVLLAASALGGVLGAVVAAGIRARLGYGWTIAASLALGALTMLGLALTTSAIAAGVLLAAYILHSVVWGICVSSLRQRLVPDELRGRVNASSKVLSLIGLTVGAGLGGTLTASLGIVAPFFAAAGLFGLCAVLATRLFRGADVPGESRADTQLV